MNKIRILAIKKFHNVDVLVRQLETFYFEYIFWFKGKYYQNLIKVNPSLLNRIFKIGFSEDEMKKITTTVLISAYTVISKLKKLSTGGAIDTMTPKY